MVPINVNIAIREKPELVQCPSNSLAEEVCTILCKQLLISPIATSLFALRLPNSHLYLSPNAPVQQYSQLTLRIRFRIPNLTRLKTLDPQAHNYYFHQVKHDVLENKVPEIAYAKHRDELLGLGITDMYRLIVEEKRDREDVEKDYRKYIPREVIKKHRLFAKKPIHNSLLQFVKSGYDDPVFIKEQYLNKFYTMAPNYLSEEFEVVYDCNISGFSQAVLHVTPFHKEEPGLRIFNKSRKEWEHVCTIEDICSMSLREDGTIEINRRNGVPVYLKFIERKQMMSFVSVCDGYYRLMVNWTFNLCKVVTSPLLQLLYNLKCHGPVGGEFSYHKLQEKRDNKPGCFILRQCEKFYDTYYLDVCSKNSTKPESYKIEKTGNSYMLYDKDKSLYASLPELISSHKVTESAIYLQECLPPSEYDKSQVLLCEDTLLGAGSRIGQDSLDDVLAGIKGPRCIHARNILIFKSPWCYVNSNTPNVYKRESCNVPFCDTLKNYIFTILNNDYYHHYISLVDSSADLYFGMKLWDPDSVLYAYGKLVFSVISVPGKTNDISRWGGAIEIIISSTGTGLTIGSDDSPLNPHPILLNSVKYTYFQLEITDDSISINLPGEENKVLYTAPLKKRLLLQNNKLEYYSFHGTNVLWTFPKLLTVCQIHTLFDTDYVIKWKLQNNDYRYDQKFYVRSHYYCSVELLNTPVSYTFRFIIRIGTTENKLQVVFQDYNKKSTILKEATMPKLLDYWTWQEFSLSIEYDTLTIFWMHNTGFVSVLSVADDHFESVRWFSMGSDLSISHWTLDCKPESIPPAEPPECVSSLSQLQYAGHGWLSVEGYPCIPWVDSANIPESIKKVHLEGAELANVKNYCRDHLKSKSGPSCMASTPRGYGERLCDVRPCQDVRCTGAGTGGDFVGALSTTRYSYTCVVWNNIDPAEKAKFPEKPFDFDGGIVEAKSNCRNPTKNIGGPWCYTTHKSVLVDLCDVSDCEQDKESTIVFVSPAEEKNIFFVLPSWKCDVLNIALKLWIPGNEKSFTIKILPLDRKKYLSIVFDKDGKKLVLSYGETSSKIVEMLQEKILTDLIPTGKWGKHWLKMYKGRILFGYWHIENPVFEWQSEQEAHAFEPLYLMFLPVLDNPVGIHFPDGDCLIETTKSNQIHRFNPFGLWSRMKKPFYTYLTLSMRGIGKTCITLSTLPNTENYHTLTLDIDKNTIKFIEYEKSKANELKSVYTNSKIMTHDSWTKFHLSINGNNLKLYKKDVLLSYVSLKPFVFHWFSVTVESGWTTWAANCDPPEPNDSPVNGGWGEWGKWDCSAKCGGGHGRKRRKCDNPKPNILGDSCVGSYSASGRCNDFECGDLSSEIIKNVKLLLKKYQSSIIAPEGTDVTFHHSLHMAQLFHLDTPETTIYWLFNAEIIEEINHSNWSVLVERGFSIKNVSWANSGVYAILAKRLHNDKKVIVSVETLAVKSKSFDIAVYVGTVLRFSCRGIALGFAYEDLSQKWILNENVYKDFGVTFLPSTNAEDVRIEESHSGVWQCQVKSDVNFVWTTNIVVIKVKVHTLLSSLMEDPVLGKFFKLFKTELNVLIFLIVISILYVIFSVIVCIFCLRNVTYIPRVKRNDSSFYKNTILNPATEKRAPKSPNVIYEPGASQSTTSLNKRNRKPNKKMVKSS